MYVRKSGYRGYLGSIREAYLSLSVNYGQNSAPGQSLVLARTSTPNPPPRKFEGGLSLPKYSTHLASHTSLFCVGTHLLNSIIGFHGHFDAQTPGVSILRKFAREGAAVSSCGVKESDQPPDRDRPPPPRTPARRANPGDPPQPARSRGLSGCPLRPTLFAGRPAESPKGKEKNERMNEPCRAHPRFAHTTSPPDEAGRPPAETPRASRKARKKTTGGVYP